MTELQKWTLQSPSLLNQIAKYFRIRMEQKEVAARRADPCYLTYNVIKSKIKTSYTESMAGTKAAQAAIKEWTTWQEASAHEPIVLLRPHGARRHCGLGWLGLFVLR